MTIDKAKLKALAERSILGHPSAPGNLSDLNQAGSVYRASTRPPVVLDLLAEIERLERKNENQSETIRQYQDHFEGGDSILSLTNERDQLKAENEALRDGANFRAIQSLRLDCEALRKDAEIGRLVFQFFDRMDDPADCDPLEKSTGDFLRAVSAAMAKAVQP